MEDTAYMAPLLLGIFIGSVVKESTHTLKPWGCKVSEDRTQAILRFEQSGNTYTISVQYQGITTAMPSWEEVHP